MGAMASQITSLTIVHATVYTGAVQAQFKPLALYPVTSEFPAQMATNAENAPIWLRHHETSYGI